MDLLSVIGALVLIAGGLLAASTVIVARRPDAQHHIDKLVPFQAIIGISLLVLGFINLVKNVEFFKQMSGYPFYAGAFLSVIGCSILLGFLFGMPVIGKLIPGNSSAEQKAAQIASQIAGFQIILGALGILSALIYLVFHLLKLPLM